MNETEFRDVTWDGVLSYLSTIMAGFGLGCLFMIAMIYLGFYS